jgi:hypothetical protein
MQEAQVLLIWKSEARTNIANARQAIAQRVHNGAFHVSDSGILPPLLPGLSPATLAVPLPDRCSHRTPLDRNDLKPIPIERRARSQSDVLSLETDIMEEKQSEAPLAFREELIQAIEIWNETPVSILDQQAVHTHALLLAMGKYITYRKERGELENCADASEFLDRFITDL